MTDFLSSAEHKIVWRMLVTKHLTIDFHCTENTHTHTHYRDISQNILFYAPQKKESQKALEGHEGEEMMTDVCFLVNCLFKLLDPAQNLPHEKMCHAQESKCGKCVAVSGTAAETEPFLMIFKGIWHSWVMSRLLCKCASDIHVQQFYWSIESVNVFISLSF